MSTQNTNSNRQVRERTPCEKFVQRLMGSWAGIGDTEGLNRNIYMSNLKITHNARDPGNIGSAVAKSQTSDPDPNINLNFAAFWKCTGPKDINFVVHHQQGNIEIVKGQIENDEGSAATMETEDRLSTGSEKFLATKHRWYFDQKRNDDVRSSAASNRFSNVDNVRHAPDERLMKRMSPMMKERGSERYVDDEVLIRHFWVATEDHPRLELVQRTKYTTNHHAAGGDARRKDLSQLSGNAAFY